VAEPSTPASPDSPHSAPAAPAAEAGVSIEAPAVSAAAAPVAGSEPSSAGTVPAAKTPAAKTPAAAGAAKAKPPAPEDKPFNEFVPQLLLPALAKECQAYGGPAPTLVFEEGPMPVVGGNCWKVQGDLPRERRFWLCFATPDLGAIKTIALAEGGSVPSLLEPFLSDEKKMTLALIVSRLVQRLNGQKWLGPN
jgi:hypothetical protein